MQVLTLESVMAEIAKVKLLYDNHEIDINELKAKVSDLEKNIAVIKSLQEKAIDDNKHILIKQDQTIREVITVVEQTKHNKWVIYTAIGGLITVIGFFIKLAVNILL